MNDLIKNYGTFADLDECGKCYTKGTCPFCWLDFNNDDEDHSQFFDEFGKWWESIPFDEQVYNYQIMIL